MLPFAIKGMVPSNERLLEQTTARMRVSALAARIADDRIDELLVEWGRLEDEVVGRVRTQEQRQDSGTRMAKIGDALHVRAGELLREASESK